MLIIQYWDFSREHSLIIRSIIGLAVEALARQKRMPLLLPMARGIRYRRTQYRYFVHHCARHSVWRENRLCVVCSGLVRRVFNFRRFSLDAPSPPRGLFDRYEAYYHVVPRPTGSTARTHAGRRRVTIGQEDHQRRKVSATGCALTVFYGDLTIPIRDH